MTNIQKMSPTTFVVLLLAISVELCLGQQQCADKPDTAVVVVASVFTTLAVVFIILGIIACCLWRRRRGKSLSPPSPSHIYCLIVQSAWYHIKIELTSAATATAMQPIGQEAVNRSMVYIL